MQILALVILALALSFSAVSAPAAQETIRVLRPWAGPPGDCISAEQRAAVRALERDPLPAGAPTGQAVLFQDPLDSGMNTLGRTVILYVDHDPAVGTNEFLDYTCREAAYDGHLGTDIVIMNFVEMDEGVPVLAAHAGTVTFTQDGEFDRHLSWVNNSIGNAVILDHGNGLQTCYWHMKKNSVRVDVGDVVAAGDTLGMVGSSGQSAFPHLHFEVTESGVNRDPFQGTCQADPSLWVEQGAHTLDLPFMLQDHGLMTLPVTKSNLVERVPDKTHVTAGSEITSWALLRSMQAGDVVRFEFQFEDSIWYSSTQTVFASDPLAWWLDTRTLPSDPGIFGEWTVHVLRNDSLIAEQRFQYDDTPNQAPVVDAASYLTPEGMVYTGEFTGNDPDGSIFWFRPALGWPVHGNLEVFGGRNRNFRYTPNPGFVGIDSIRVHAEDDELLAGPVTWIHFQVGDPVPVVPVADLQGTSSELGIEIRWRSTGGGRGSVLLIERQGRGEPGFREVHRRPFGEGSDQYLDADVVVGESYAYRLVLPDRAGARTVFGPIAVTAGAAPARFALLPGSPNPFSSTIRMQFTLPVPGAVGFAVFDARGRRVHATDLGHRGAGTHSVSWDGRDDRGNRAPAGIYFLRLSGGGEVRTQKAMLIAGD